MGKTAVERPREEGWGRGEAVRDWETLTCDVGWKGGKGLDMWWKGETA